MKFVDINSYYTDPKYLSIYRLLYCFFLMFFIGLPSFTWLGSNLDPFFSPPTWSLSNLFPGFPSKHFFLILSLINLLAFVSMFLGITKNIAAIVFTVSSIIAHNFWYSFGKIDHLLLWYTLPLFLSYAGWSTHFTIFKNSDQAPLDRRAKDRIAFIMSLLALFIAFTMFTSGIQKLMGGWWRWDREAVRFQLINNYFTMQRHEFFAAYFLHVKSHIVWKFMDYSALILEIGFLFAVFKRSYFQFFLLFGFIFHLSVLLMFNISFYANVICYFAFLNFASISYFYKRSIFSRFGLAYKMRLPVLITGSILCVFWLFCLWYRQSVFRLPSVIDLERFNDTTFQDPSPFAATSFFFTCAVMICLALAAEILKSAKKF